MKVFILFCISCLLFPHSEGFLKPVSSVLKSKWPDYPIILEISEFLYDEDPAYFWSFVDSTSQHGFYDVKWSDKEKYKFLMSEAGRYVSKDTLDLLKLSVSLRSYSPKIVMYHHIAAQKNYPTNCTTFVDINGVGTCDLTQLDKAIAIAQDVGRAEIFKIDHVYPGPALPEGKSRPVVAILYGEIGTPEFSLFHHALRGLARVGRVDYVLRHYVAKPSHERIRLSGYGVELQIKSTEYKASDDSKIVGNVTYEDLGRQTLEGDEVEGFLFEQLSTLYPDKVDKLEALKAELIIENSDFTPMKVWQLQDLSNQAATRILESPKKDQLKTLSSISQNFPVQARSLVRTKVSDKLRKEMKRNQEIFRDSLNLSPGDSAVFLNGQYFDVDSLDVFTLIDAIKSDLRLMHGFHKVGVPAEKIQDLLLLKVDDDQEYLLDIRDSAVRYVNDIETEVQYSRWPASVTELLRPTYPGMIRSLRKNINHLIFVLDPVDIRAKPLVKFAESFLLHNVPLRIGFVFAVNPLEEATGENDAGVALLNVFNYITEEEDMKTALSFITDLYSIVGTNKIEVADVKKVFKKKYKKVDSDAVFGVDSEYDVGRKLAEDFLRRTDLKDLPQVLFNGKPLDKSSLEQTEFEEAVIMEIMKTMNFLAKAVMRGEVKDDDNILNYIMSQPNVVTRFNNRILRAEPKFLQVDGSALPRMCATNLIEIEERDIAASMVKHMAYISGCKDIIYCPVTVWIVTDLTRAEEREALSEYISFVKKSKNLRIGVIHNGKAHPEHVVSIPNLYQTIMDHAPADKIIPFVETILKPSNAKALESGAKKISEINGLAELEPKYEHASEMMHCDRLFVERVLKWDTNARGVVANGQIFGPFEPEENFSVSDLELVMKVMLSPATKIYFKLGDFSSQESSNLIFKTHAIVAQNTGAKKRHELAGLSTSHSVLEFTASDKTLPVFKLDIILDPLTPAAQKISGILLPLSQALNADIRIFFNCIAKHSQMPLKSFYRFVLESEIQFTQEGKSLPGPAAVFGLPQATPLLTLNMQVPDNWLVEAVESVHDLDNIKLSDIEGGVHSEFELEHLLLEGQCFEQPTGSPPRGLQLVLGTANTPNVVDTIVMANLGYFQLKANPGVWELKLREGRSDELYNIASQEGTVATDTQDNLVLVYSFKSHMIKLKVQKKPGKEMEDLLGEEEEEGGLWSSFASKFSGTSTESKEETLNVFSLASGHLYERLLRIMMLSVLKQTKTPVKFWFLKNYLSPTFKRVLPHMAKKYGFQYELVQYKWPRWLNQQTEKQRIIWGYKILFLDVLFPLDVKKIIFVDADQVVRADLTELRDLDLGGAPYGYTPFCESRKEMDGYRFWKQGYWKNHLQGRKYHISALYVVDLKKFRKIAAGDRLRGQYQALSQDPNSLSNLDQDLPNNMIHQVAIKSLPQDWLWCETWCDDASKKTAKTIDLCNNPMTKESKLTAAQRIIKEWSSYDNEIKELLNELNGSSAAKSEERTAHDPAEL